MGVRVHGYTLNVTKNPVMYILQPLLLFIIKQGPGFLGPEKNTCGTYFVSK